MTKKRLILLSALIFLVAILYKFSPIKAVDNPQNGINIVLHPQKPVVKPGETFGVDLTVFPNNNTLSAAEIHVSYDPQKLAPASSHPFTIKPPLDFILPNCDFSETCPATSSADLTNAIVYLGVTCSDATGCLLPSKTDPFTLATVFFTALPNATGTTNLYLKSPNANSLLAALEFDLDATKLSHSAVISLSSCNSPFDLNADGLINVLDIMQISSHWNTAHGQDSFLGHFDLNKNGSVDVSDIQTISTTWNQPCL